MQFENKLKNLLIMSEKWKIQIKNKLLIGKMKNKC